MSIHKPKPLTRRTFLAASAAGLAAASLRAEANEPMRTGLIGCGAVGSVLLDQIQTHSLPLRVVAVADTDARCLDALPKHLRRDTSGQHLIDDAQLDAIIIATPDHFHAPLAVAALEAGKQVYLVPPLARSREELASLQQAAAAFPGQLHVGMDQAIAGYWAQCALEWAHTKDGIPRWIQADVRNNAPRPALHWSRLAACSQGDAATALFSTLYPLLACFDLDTPIQSQVLGGIFDHVYRENPDALSLTAHLNGGTRITLTTRNTPASLLPTVIRGQQALVAPLNPPVPGHFDTGDWARAVYRGQAADTRRLNIALNAQATLIDALEELRNA